MDALLKIQYIFLKLQSFIDENLLIYVKFLHIITRVPLRKLKENDTNIHPKQPINYEPFPCRAVTVTIFTSRSHIRVPASSAQQNQQ